jgi:hypothetical protein
MTKFILWGLTAAPCQLKIPSLPDILVSVFGQCARYLSTIQAGFFRLCQMTKFNCFWGLQSGFKPLSIYTVVLLYDGSRLQQAEQGAGLDHAGNKPKTS